jgi:hypothetical protein
MRHSTQAFTIPVPVRVLARGNHDVTGGIKQERDHSFCIADQGPEGSQLGLVKYGSSNAGQEDWKFTGDTYISGASGGKCDEWL